MKEFKAKQKVWWYDQAAYEIKPGVLVSPENQSDREEDPTFHVRTEELYKTIRINHLWVFHTREEGTKFLKKKLESEINSIKKEMKYLQKTLKELS